MLKKIEDYEQALLHYIHNILPNTESIQTVEELSDGIILSTILKQAKGFRFEFGELNEKVETWGERLKNLRLIIKKIEEYFETKIGKGIKTKDINLISLTYSRSSEEILKLFQVILGVLIQAPNKEDHISRIMKFDEQIQLLFVELIQKIMESRILPKNQKKEDKIDYILEQFKIQNSLLRQEISSLHLQKEQDSKELQDLKEFVKKSEGDFESLLKSMQLDSSEWSISTIIQNENLKSMVDMLKKRLSTLSSEHEYEVSKLKEEIKEKEMRIMVLSQTEDVLEIYKQKYHEALMMAKSGQNWEREKTRLLKMIEEKQRLNRKIQEKLDQYIEEHYSLQERQAYLLLQLEKRQTRFQQLQKEVRKRIKNSEELSTFTITESIRSNFQMSEPQEQIDQLEQEVNRLKVKEKQAFRDRNQLRRTTEKQKNLTEQKKKLQRIILQLTTEKKEEVIIMVGVMDELSKENRRMKSLLISNNIEFV